MKKFVLKRTCIALLTVFLILLLLFLMLDFMPGSPFNNEEKMSAEQIADLYHKYGLDQPIINRFFLYLKNMLHGDFGISYSLPSFVFALLLSYFFGFKFKLFPFIYNTKNELQSSILPTISLSMFTIASVARYTRSEMVDILNSDYYLLSDSKGLPKAKLIFHHAIRNAMISVITVLAPLIVNLMTGSLVVEKAFSIPGLGSLYVSAIQSNDFNVVLAISFIYSLMFIFTMLLVDILYGVIDPRIRLAKGE